MDTDFLSILTIIKKLKILACLLQSMTCKDAINSDTNSEEEKLYLLEKSRTCNKCFRFGLEGTADQLRISKIPSTSQIQPELSKIMILKHLHPTIV